MKPADRPRALLEALTKQGFSQSDIERNTGIDQTQVSRLLTGKLKDMRLEPYLKLRQFAIKCGIAV